MTNLAGNCLRTRLHFRSAEPLKQEGGFFVVLCDDSGASPNFLHQFNGLLAP